MSAVGSLDLDAFGESIAQILGHVPELDELAGLLGGFTAGFLQC
ncbi:MAG: hypothetical protein VCA18_09635 [Opitutales bacterium]